MTPGLVLAKGGGVKKWTFAMSAGYSSTDFSGVSDSDFSKLTHYNNDFSIIYSKPSSKQYWGLGYKIMPSMKFSDVQWNNGDTGNYKLSINTIYAFYGLAYKDFRSAITVGSETMTWTGTPDSAPSSSSYFTPGVLIGYNLAKKGPVNFPLTVRYWSLPERKVSFANYPSDTIEAEAGGAYDINVMAQFDIK